MSGTDSYAQILRSSSIIGGALGLSYLVGLIRVKLIAVLLGPSGVGLVSLYTSAMGMIGMVSNLYENKQGTKIVQTQIPLNPGNSGGPIFDRTGRVVAIVSRGATTANSINLGVHVADAFLVFDQLLPVCGCLAIDVKGAAPVFLDDAMIGKGPRVLVAPKPGVHTVSVVVDGKQLERVIHFPADQRIKLQ